MDNKKVLLMIFFGMFLIVCSYSVSPALTWLAPTTSGTNHTSDITIIVSYVNGTGITNPLAANSTFFYNNTMNESNTGAPGTPSGWDNFTFDNSYFSSWTVLEDANGANISAVLDITAIGDNRFIWFNITLGNFTGVNFTNTAAISNITIDDTAPTVSFINATDFSNHSYAYDSGNFLLVNVSITNDSISDGPSTNITLNITGPDGVQNSTYTLFQQGDYWANNITTGINVSLLPEGKCNLTVQAVNDTFGNEATLISTITIDNTAPTVTFTCSPSSVIVGGTTTCTCSGSAYSNLESNSYGTYTTQTLNNQGTFTETCTVTSFVGLSTTTTVSYTVTGSSGSSSSVATTGAAITWSLTHNIGDEAFEQGVTKELAAKERVKVSVAGGTHYVGVKSVTANSATIEITSDPVSVTLNIGEEAKVDVDNDGIYDIYVKLNSILNGKADVLVQKLSEEVPAGEGSVSTTGEIEEAEPEEAEGISKTWIWIIIIVIIILIGIGFGIKKRR